MDSEWSKVFGIGGNVSFTLSYAIAKELHDMAIALGYETYELVILVFIIVIFLAATPIILGLVLGRVSLLLSSKVQAQLGQLFKKKSRPSTRGGRTLPMFFQTLSETASQIALSLLVQILATSASSGSGAFRIDRVLALFSVSVFFIFLDTGSRIRSRPNAVRTTGANRLGGEPVAGA